MRKRTAAWLLLPLIAVPAARAQDRPDPRFEAAYLAWDRGDYIPALEGFARVLGAPGGERFQERIALLTGEYFTTTELAADGRGVQVGPKGEWGAYEVGNGAERTTRLVSLGAGKRTTVTLRGSALTFAPTGDRVAYLALRETPELESARHELERAIEAGDRPGAQRQRATVAYQEARGAEVVVRELVSGKERRFDKGGLIVGELTFSADGRTLYATAAGEDASATSDIYALTEKGAPTALTRGAGHKFAPVAARGGKYLVYQTGPRGAVPQSPGAALAQRASVDLMQVVIHELATGRSRAYPGVAATVAADGSAAAYLVRDGAENLVQVVQLAGGEPRAAVRTTDPIAVPALSPDGKRVVYQRMPREDWEIFLAAADGSTESRITHDIQHDLMPVFVTPDTLLYIKGEPRHRRSYLYAIGEGKEIRLFHNNTVRTIAPEYEWQMSPDGSKVLIISERDGDTISPERGVYMVDLRRPVTKGELAARIQENLAAESELRTRGEKMFAPIAQDVRTATAAVSKTKIYDYENALFHFGSKHITKPGNRKASEYLFNTLKSWGYEPEYQWLEPSPGVRTANVVARLEGTVHPDLVYVVGSHYDSVEHGPGADDDASGTAVLLESARVLKDRPQAATILFVFYTGEESGLLGSREFTRRAVANGLHVIGALNNDMVGFSVDHRTTNTIRYSNDGIRDLQHAAAFLFSDLVTYDARYFKGTDAHSLYDAYGDVIGGIGSYPVLASPHYHQSHDVLETIDHERLKQTARTNVASLMLLASSPARLKGLEAARQGKAVVARWSAAPEKEIRHYLVRYTDESGAGRTETVTTPSVTLPSVRAGTVIAVKAVNARGLEGWDWARVEVR